MSYTINLTNGNVFCVIPDGAINTQSSMTLLGKNYAGYGQMADDNWLHLLENSANSTAPSAPLAGQLWWDSANQQLKVWTGVTWKAANGATNSATAPTNNALGDLWFDTANQQLKVWNGSSWTLVGPPYSSGQGITGSIPATIVDTTSTSHTVLEEYVGNTIVAIISQDPTFTPQVPIAGFTTVNPGYTLASAVGTSNSVPQYWGTASNANLLGGFAAAQFMRADANTATTGTLSVLNNAGLAVGVNSQFTANASTTTPSNVTLANNDPNGNLDINVNQGGTSTTAIHINGATGAVTIPGLTGVTATTASNIAGGSAGQIPFQTAPGVTSFTPAPTTANTALVWNGTSFVYGNIVESITGTTNQVFVNAAVTAASGNVTLSLPQNIDTAALVQFGSFGVGVAASGTAGEILATNNVTAYFVSDKKFKENVKDIEGALSKVECIGGKTFDWTDEYLASKGGADGYFYQKSDFGVIAQDVQQVFPTAVRTKADGTLAVDYEKLSALAFAAVKELNAKVDALIAKLDL